MQELWTRIDSYSKLSDESRTSWQNLMSTRKISKNNFFVKEGQITRTVAFVSRGLFSQYYLTEKGDTITKRFFPETYFLASMTALLTRAPSLFYIKALEDCEIIEYNFYDFKDLTEKYRDIASVYIQYMERHWVIEKEPFEISLRSDSAKTRYLAFLENYPAIELRLKQHEIASYLGITPTQLSRIRAEK